MSSSISATQIEGLAERSGEPAAQGWRLPYLPGLDGLRAMAVMGVLLYHAGMLWLPGGFLGVEVFFVISGYLITSLLLSEWQRHRSVNLPAFWLRRARRLLPALFLVIAVTLAFSVLFLPEEPLRSLSGLQAREQEDADIAAEAAAVSAPSSQMVDGR